MTVSREGHDVSFALVGAEPGEVDAPFWWWDDWEKLTYRDVSGTADLEYRVEPGAVKESVVLDAAPATRTSWTWRIDSDSLTPTMGEAGSVVFTDDAGTAVLMIPTPGAYARLERCCGSVRERRGTAACVHLEGVRRLMAIHTSCGPVLAA